MKLVSRLALVSLVVASLITPAFFGVPAGTAATTNLIANPSVETATNGAPTGWLKGGWGTNTATLSYASTGQDGAHSLSVNVSAYTNGDAKWYFAPVTVTPGTVYTYSNWYQSTVATEVDAQITDTAGNVTYAWLASPAATTAWTQVNATWTAPANAKSVTIFHVIAQKGTLSTDNFSLTAGTVTPTPTPTVTPTPTPTPSPSVSPGPTPSPTPTPTPTPAPTPAPGANLLPNPSFETANGTVPASWTSDAWGTNKPVFSYLTTGHTGTHSLKVTITGYTNGSANWDAAPVAITPGQRYQFTDWYQSNVTTEVDAGVTMSDGTVQYVYLGTVPASTTWAQEKVQFDAPAGATNVTVFHLIAANGYLTTDDYSFATYTPAPFTRGLVSITFDDGWTNQYTNALPLLKKYSELATFYIISGELTDQPDYMSVAQIKALQAQGSEIASHSVTHPDLTTLSAANLTKEMSQSQSTLVKNFGNVITDFADPFGAYNAKTIAEGQKYYQTQRTTDSGYNSKDNINFTTLKVQDIYNTTTPAQVQAWVNQAAADHTWLILVYHEVGTTPIDPTDTQYITTPSDLDAELAIIKNSGLGIVTVNQAVKEIKPQL